MLNDINELNEIYAVTPDNRAYLDWASHIWRKYLVSVSELQQKSENVCFGNIAISVLIKHVENKRDEFLLWKSTEQNKTDE